MLDVVHPRFHSNAAAMTTTLPAHVHAEFLRCALCGDTVTRPKLLPCAHTFCAACLQRLVARSTTDTARLWFLCPTCTAITEIPAAGVKAFRFVPSGFHTCRKYALL